MNGTVEYLARGYDVLTVLLFIQINWCAEVRTYDRRPSTTTHSLAACERNYRHHFSLSLLSVIKYIPIHRTVVHAQSKYNFIRCTVDCTVQTNKPDKQNKITCMDTTNSCFAALAAIMILCICQYDFGQQPIVYYRSTKVNNRTTKVNNRTIVYYRIRKYTIIVQLYTIYLFFQNHFGQQPILHNRIVDPVRFWSIADCLLSYYENKQLYYINNDDSMCIIYICKIKHYRLQYFTVLYVLL